MARIDGGGAPIDNREFAAPRRSFGPLLIGCLIILTMASCSPRVKTSSLIETTQQYAPDCTLDVFIEPITPSRPVAVTGDIDVEDSGVSLFCGKEKRSLRS